MRKDTALLHWFVSLINVNGYSNTSQNKILLDTLTKIIAQYKQTHVKGFTLLGGEFNIAPD